MTYEIKTLEVQSTDNIHTLKGLIYIPEGEIRGIFHLVHGMCEYIGRYAHIFSALAEQGYVHGEEQHQHAYEYCLSDDGCRHLVLCGAASLHLSLKR